MIEQPAVAVHVAGHAVVALAFGLPLGHATAAEHDPGVTLLADAPDGMTCPRQLAAVHAAGLAVEHLALGDIHAEACTGGDLVALACLDADPGQASADAAGVLIPAACRVAYLAEALARRGTLTGRTLSAWWRGHTLPGEVVRRVA